MLVSDWQLLADLSFADLVLWVPTADGTRYVAVAQMRPTTGPTSYHDDLVGDLVPRGRRPMLDAALRRGPDRARGRPRVARRGPGPGRVDPGPPRRPGDRASSPGTPTCSPPAPRAGWSSPTSRAPSDLAQMIAAGALPLPGRAGRHGRARPRVGDGLIRLDARRRRPVRQPQRPVRLPPPRPGRRPRRRHLGELDRRTRARRAARSTRRCRAVASGGRRSEARGRGATTAVVQLRAIPLKPGGDRLGALVLVPRRHRTAPPRARADDQGRDDPGDPPPGEEQPPDGGGAAAAAGAADRTPQGREALEEAVRRVGSIAIVHETLSQTLDERVEFDEIADRVLAMVAEMPRPRRRSTMRPDGQLRRCCRRGGHAARDGAHRAAAERARSTASRGGAGRRRGRGRASESGGAAAGRGADDGRGLPDGLRPRARPATWACRSSGRWWRASWAGSFDMQPPGPRRGTTVILDVPVQARK